MPNAAAKVQKFPKVTKYFSEIRSKKSYFVIIFCFLGAKKINGGFLSQTLPSYMCQNLVLAVSTRVCSEVLCVASNTRSAIRSTSSPAQIEICGVPIPPCQIVAVNLLFYVRACPHSGDYSGTSLGVRSVALLHSQATLVPLPYIEQERLAVKIFSMQKSIQIPLFIYSGKIITADEFV